ncbi:binding partner of ACD11 1-like [Gossypium australe]|uniref:Binding partner of ACD11 1-like n=1 Tax=Gossypium australe TaxID=47621 RepID=A0A5B6UNJ8_9ROSI|nr:binding partner of ACD11 1-like [Gossypium australe]
MAIQSVKVGNVSLGASEQDIKEFFSFSGDIEHVEMHGNNERSQVAYVTFKDPQGAETAVLLSVRTYLISFEFFVSIILIVLTDTHASHNWILCYCLKEMKITLLLKDLPLSLISFSTRQSPLKAKCLLIKWKLRIHGFLQGATIVDQSVTIELAPDYKPPATAYATPATQNKEAGQAESAVQKAEDVVTSMLAKGFILGKDAVNKAKAFDEKHQFTSTATAKVASLDQKIGFTEKISAGTTMVNDKVREMDQKFQVSEKTKSAIAAAEQTVSSAGSAIMKNRYVLTGTSWVTGAFNRVAKAAGDVGQKTKEKVLAEEEEAHKSKGYARMDESESPKAAAPSAAQGLIL